MMKIYFNVPSAEQSEYSDHPQQSFNLLTNIYQQYCCFPKRAMDSNVLLYKIRTDDISIIRFGLLRMQNCLKSHYNISITKLQWVYEHLKGKRK